MSSPRSGALNFNLFTWIREGVKQSVLLGVSDAVETLGVPAEGEDIRPKLLEFLRHESAEALDKNAAIGGSKPRRLGRTLKDLEADGTV
jgi:hypothetical protein